MTDFIIHEIVRCGTANAYVKNYFSANGKIVLERIDPRGSITAGSTIIGDLSKAVMTLPSTFHVSDDFDDDSNDYKGFNEIFNQVVNSDAGLVVIDEYNDAYEYETTFYVVVDQ